MVKIVKIVLDALKYAFRNAFQTVIAISAVWFPLLAILFLIENANQLTPYIEKPFAQLAYELAISTIALAQIIFIMVRIYRGRHVFLVKNRLTSAAPGGKLASYLSTLYCKKKYETVFQQTIADMREEYFEALAAGYRTKAAWIRVRGTYSVLAAVFMDVPVSIIRLITKIWKASQ